MKQQGRSGRVRNDFGEVPNSSIRERRSEPRLHVPMHVKVCGTDLLQRAFQVGGRVENINQGGLYVELGEQIGVGAKLLIFVSPPNVVVETQTTPFSVMRGIVTRVEHRGDGMAGVGVRITHRREERVWDDGLG
ncbi:MAG: PilZ domain-containing protein [Pyrinomonadaceae bacterium]